MARDEAMDQALGAAIKRARRALSAAGHPLTQVDFAREIKIAKTDKSASVTASRIESGAVHVSEERLALIAQALNTTPEALKAEAQASLLAQAREQTLSAASDARGGVAKAVRTALGGAQAQQNYLLRTEIEAEVAERQQRLEARLTRLNEVQAEVVEGVITPFVELASTIDANSLPVLLGVPEISSDPRLEAHHDFLRSEVLNTAGLVERVAKAAWVGTLLRPATASAVLGLVSASATASTGAAISSLSGAAATNAAMAWLGGGSLAAGGMGVAGGTVVLASIATLPALIAAGGVFAFESRRMRRQALEESDRLAKAKSELDRTGPILETALQRMARQQAILEALTTSGLRQIRWVQRRSEANSESGHNPEDDAQFIEQFRALSALVVIATSVVGLPVQRALSTEERAPAEVEAEAKWIELVFGDAEAQMQAWAASAPQPGVEH